MNVIINYNIDIYYIQILRIVTFVNWILTLTEIDIFVFFPVKEYVALLQKYYPLNQNSSNILTRTMFLRRIIKNNIFIRKRNS